MIDILIMVLVALALFAIVAYVLQNYVPMDSGLRNVVMLILGIIFVIWILLMLTGHAPTWGGRVLW